VIEYRKQVEEKEEEGCGASSANSEAGDCKTDAQHSQRDWAPRLGTKSVWGGDLGDDGKSSMGTPSKFAAASGRWKTIRVVKGDTEGHQKIAAYWMQKLDAGSAMAGVMLGKEKREAADAAERLHAAESPALAVQLREAISLVTESEKLNPALLTEQTPISEINATVLAVTAGGVQIPQTVAIALIRRHAALALELGDIAGVLKVVSPWPSCSKKEHTFQPTEPELSVMGCHMSLAQRYAWFQQHVVDGMLVGALHKGEPGLTGLALYSKALMELLVQIQNRDDTIDSDDDTGAAEDQEKLVPDEISTSFAMLLSCARACHYLATMKEGPAGATADSAVSFLDAVVAWDRKKESPQSRCAAMMRTGVWAERMSRIRSSAGAERVAKRELTRALEKVTVEDATPAALRSAQSVLEKYSDSCREEALLPLKNAFVDGVKRWAQTLRELAAQPDPQPTCSETDLEECKQLFADAPTLVSDVRTSCSEARKTVILLQESISQQFSLKALRESMIMEGFADNSGRLVEAVAAAKRDGVTLGTGKVPAEALDEIVSSFDAVFDAMAKAGLSEDLQTLVKTLDNVDQVIDLLDTAEARREDYSAKAAAWRDVLRLREVHSRTLAVQGWGETPLAERQCDILELQQALQKADTSRPHLGLSSEDLETLIVGAQESIDAMGTKDIAEMESEVKNLVASIDEAIDPTRTKSGMPLSLMVHDCRSFSRTHAVMRG